MTDNPKSIPPGSQSIMPRKKVTKKQMDQFIKQQGPTLLKMFGEDGMKIMIERNFEVTDGDRNGPR